MTIETVSLVTWAHCPTRSHTITAICSVQLVAQVISVPPSPQMLVGSIEYAAQAADLLDAWW